MTGATAGTAGPRGDRRGTATGVVTAAEAVAAGATVTGAVAAGAAAVDTVAAGAAAVAAVGTSVVRRGGYPKG